MSSALPLIAACLVLGACSSGPEPEELCAHTKKLFDETKAKHDKDAADCALTYKMIKEGSPRSKYKAFAECHLSKRTMEELKECPKLLSEKAP